MIYRFWNNIVGRMSDNYTLAELWKQDVNFDLLTIMHFTGLTDKDGKHIYESDIIETSRGDWGVIVWKAPFFEVTVSETQSCLYSREFFNDVKVIGNIYNNPELLKK